MGRSSRSSFLALLAGVQSATLEMKLGLLTDAWNDGIDRTSLGRPQARRSVGNGSKIACAWRSRARGAMDSLAVANPAALMEPLGGSRSADGGYAWTAQ